MIRLSMFVVYIILNLYVLAHVMYWFKKVLSDRKRVRRACFVFSAAVIAVWASTLMLWLAVKDGPLKTFMISAGNCWLGFLIENVTILFITDVVIMISNLIRHRKTADFSRRTIGIIGAGILAVSVLLTVLGVMNINKLRLRTLDAYIDKPAAVSDLKIALIADTHLGYSIGAPQMQRMVDMINSQDPDVVVIAGDIFDNNYDNVKDPEKIEEILKGIDSRYGVYAVWGNHDVVATLVGGFEITGSELRDERMEEFLEKSNIRILYDEKVMIADESISLIGRVDGEHTGTTEMRHSLTEMMDNVDKSRPVIMINHEPDELGEYAQSGVDVLLSGHTHAGQTFPLNLGMALRFKNLYGCRMIDGMYSFVTSGVGLYGPTMRTFIDPEVMIINCHFGGQ